MKSASLAFDGSAYRTMLRNDAYWFSRLGVYIERADNTARILDVKYHVLLPETERVGGSLDYFQWSTILREVSALTAYHWVYRAEPEALARGGPADPQPADAAFAGVLLREHRACSSTISDGPMGGRACRSACRAAFWRGWRTPASRTSSRARPARVHLGLHRGQRQARLRGHGAISGLKAPSGSTRRAGSRPWH